ncbi:MAG: hypothetical protein ACPG8W_13315 [Candidatus Promineifilaceae bacterium]
MSSSPSTKTRITALLCILSVLAYVGMASVDWRFGTLRDQFVVQTIGWYLAAFVPFVALIVWAERCRGISMRWIWGAAIVARLLLLTTTPTLSDDVYRYLWDGHVAANGVSPYALPIDSAELNHLDTPIRALANNTWMASPYMPSAQFIFHNAARLLPLSPLTLQILMVAFDLGSAYVLSKLLTLGGYAPRRLMLYLLNPFIIVEVAHSAHIDAWMLLLLLLAIYFTLRPQPSQTDKIDRSAWLAPSLFALATLTKIIPVLALPILFWRWSWKQLVGYGVLCLGLIVPAGLRAGWGLSGDLDGTGLFGALRIYANQWNFNSGLFRWIEKALEHQASSDPLGQAKLLSLLLALVVLLIVWLLARNQPIHTTLRLMLVPFGAYLLLTPTVHPWYALIVVVFVPFLAPTVVESAENNPHQPWLSTVPWLYLSATLIFSYMTYRDPSDFREFEWVRQTEWIPTLLLLGVVLLNYGRRKLLD